MQICVLQTTSTAPVPTAERPDFSQIEFGSCIELLAGKMQVQWAAIVNGVIIRLSGRIDEKEYMAFGLSGAEGRTQMIGGDVTVAYLNAADGSFHVDDYILSAQSQVTSSVQIADLDNFGQQNLDTATLRFSSSDMAIENFLAATLAVRQGAYLS